MLNSLNRGIRKFLHDALFTDARKGKHAGDRLDKYPVNRDRLESLFVRYNVKTVVARHEHFYQGKTVENIRHIITCGGGAPLYAKAAKAVLSSY
jgi:hypothetical protein